MSYIFFFRNDDVRGKLDKSLIEITNLFAERDIKICHAVEPANVSPEVVKWLIMEKEKNNVEIIQHGYDHNVRELYPYGFEFGGKRDYNSQLEDIKKGRMIMDKYFENKWEKIMSFPYGSYNSDTIKALAKQGYYGITSSIGYSLKSRMKDYFGKLLGKDIIFGKKVSYHCMQRQKYGVKEVSVSINIIKKYKGYEIADHYSIDELISKIDNSIKFSRVVGVLFHHRFHTGVINLIEQLIDFILKIEGCKVKTISEIINE